MSQVNFDLQPEWLRRHEMPRDPEILRNEAGEEMARLTSWSRNFKVSVGGDDFVLAVHHAPKPAAVMYSEIGEEVRTPTDAEVLFLLARAFLGSLPQYPPVEPDVERGYMEFRAQALETNPGRLCPPWEELNPEWREAFAAGVRRAFEGCRREAKVTRPATREEVFADLGAMPTLPAEFRPSTISHFPSPISEKP